MARSSLISKIKYKKECVGVVEKDGKTYMKYVKARRFKIGRNTKHIILFFLILGGVCLAAKLLVSEMLSTEPVEVQDPIVNN